MAFTDPIVINGCAPTRLRLTEALDLWTAGGVAGTNLTVANQEDFTESVRWAMRCMRTIEEHPTARVVRSVLEIEGAHADGVAGVIFGTQNGDPIEGDVILLEALYTLGFRIFQPAYQRRNLLANGSGEENDGGLSRLGRDVVDVANQLGLLIDLSHVAYRSTMDTIELSEDPVSFTHVNLHNVNHIPRNKRDDQIRAVAEKGGVVGVNAVSRLMLPDGLQKGATVDDFIGQIEGIVDLVGIDHVGIGLDVFEAMTEDDLAVRKETFLRAFPELAADPTALTLENYYTKGLSSGSMIRSLGDPLRQRGYSDEAIRKVLGGNFMRLFSEVWPD